MVTKWEKRDEIDLVEKEDEVKSDKAKNKIQSVTVIEQENENDENEVRPEGDVRLEEMIQEKNKERNKKKGLNK